jgi:hypothetical protein
MKVIVCCFRFFGYSQFAADSPDREKNLVEKTAVAEEQLVVFNLGEGNYAIDIATVREIIQMPAITRVPGSLSNPPKSPWRP